MEWLTTDRILQDQDLRVFRFSRMRSLVLKCNTNACVTDQTLESDEEWEQWLGGESAQRKFSRRNYVAVLRASEAKAPGNGGRLPPLFQRYMQKGCQRPADPWVYLSGHQPQFQGNLHGPMHNTSPKVLLSAPSSENWENDLALSVTYSLEHKATQAVLYGCDDGTRDRIHQRLSRNACAVYHPLTLPLIFADIERDRLFSKADPLVTKLLGRALSMSKPSAFTESLQRTFQSSATGGRPVGEESPEELMQMWLSASALKQGLELWKAQLLKMQSHCPTIKFEAPSPGNYTQRQIDELRDLTEMGKRIEQRLAELIGEFDEKIGQCALLTDGMINLSIAQATYNDSKQMRSIAQATHRDSKHMRSIAMLTMVFLPATFVATLFSTGFFNWGPEPGQHMVSPYIWLYFVIATGFTCVTVVVWYWYNKMKSNQIYNDLEMRSSRTGS